MLLLRREYLGSRERNFLRDTSCSKDKGAVELVLRGTMWTMGKAQPKHGQAC